MRALKVLVVVMGVLLLGGSAALVAIIIGRSSNGRAGNGAPALSTAAVATPRAFGRASLALPAGARIEAMQGVGEKLVLRVALPDGHQQLMVVDPATGSLLGTIDLAGGG